ncbi:MAG: hypothetical protein ORN98_05215 [Alphaproteobacteria bacterium]|nr:hypothetical protein [Alphaproteobacteria bacterium]
MSEIKTIICFANSVKHKARCIVGREIFPGGYIGGWIRPIGDREHGEILRSECQYQDGEIPELLDVIRLPLISHKPKLHQPENWVVGGKKWVKIGKYDFDKATKLIENNSAEVWPHPTSKNDRIPEDFLAHIRNSVCLIKPDNNYFLLRYEEEYNGKKRRCLFRYKGVSYNLACTDPAIDWRQPTALENLNKIFQSNPPLLCISLGEIFNGYSYKLVAAVIYPKTTGE